MGELESSGEERAEARGGQDSLINSEAREQPLTDTTQLASHCSTICPAN